MTTGEPELQIVEVDGHVLLLKRGIHELKLSGEAAARLGAPLKEIAEGTRTVDEVLSVATDEDQEQLNQLLEMLVARGLLARTSEAWGQVTDEDRFFRNFGQRGSEAQTRLSQAHVAIIGTRDPLGIVLAEALLSCGIGKVVVATDDAAAPTSGPAIRNRQDMEDGRLDLRSGPPDEAALREADLICVADAAGLTPQLLEANRRAIRVDRPFLPVWQQDLVGYVGPLLLPGESACLRCYTLRLDANTSDADLRRARRVMRTEPGPVGASAGALPPMLRVVAECAAMEAAKFIGQFVPCDALGRSLEVNLVGFASAARRVLKVPRCPDCSDQARRPTTALKVGPQITHYD